MLRTSAHDFLPAACIFLSSTTTVSVTTKELSNHMIYSGKSSMKVTIELACYAFERVRITQVSPRVQPMPTVTCAQLPTDRRTPRRTFQFRLAAPAWRRGWHTRVLTSPIGLTPRDRERSGSVPLLRARAEPRRFPRPTIPSVSLEHTESADPHPPSRLSPSPLGLLSCRRPQTAGDSVTAAGLAWQVFACMRFSSEALSCIPSTATHGMDP